MSLTVDEIIGKIEALKHLHSQTSVYINANKAQPNETSAANQELTTFARPESVLTAISQIMLCVEVSADHLISFTKSVTEPALTIAPWAIARSMLESCSLGIWISTNKINARSRVSRSLAFRYDGLKEQIKLLRLIEQPDKIDKAELRLRQIEETAVTLGYKPIVDRNGRTRGICEEMPSATKLVGNTLAQEVLYRLCSAIVHGQTWALKELSFKVIDGPVVRVEDELWESPKGTRFLEKHISLEMVDLLCRVICADFSRFVWNTSRYFGWDLIRLNEILESTYQQLGVNTASMFWRFSE